MRVYADQMHLFTFQPMPVAFVLARVAQGLHPSGGQLHFALTLLASMVLVELSVPKKSLSLTQQKRVVRLRDVEGMAWDDIALNVRNLMNEHPSRQNVINVYNSFGKGRVSGGLRKFKYKNCGRTAWKFTPSVKRFLLQRMLALRKVCICTSSTLQEELVKKMHLKVSTGKIRQVLRGFGYKWLPRSQKRKYSKEVKKQRVAFARAVLRLSLPALRAKMGLSMDGVIFGIPPRDPTERANHCRVGDTHIWRKRGETASPELAGQDMYGKQVPLSRAVALWGGISHNGFQIVLFHDTKKLTQETWSDAVNKGHLTNALLKANPSRKRGPWEILVDNETFLRASDSMKAYRGQKVKLWSGVFKLPPKSPDLNPVERFWGWLRKKLRHADLADLNAGRQPLGKMAYRMRIRNICRQKAAQKVASNYARAFRTVCREVVKKKGAATRF